MIMCMSAKLQIYKIHKAIVTALIHSVVSILYMLMNSLLHIS